MMQSSIIAKTLQTITSSWHLPPIPTSCLSIGKSMRKLLKLTGSLQGNILTNKSHFWLCYSFLVYLTMSWIAYILTEGTRSTLAFSVSKSGRPLTYIAGSALIRELFLDFLTLKISRFSLIAQEMHPELIRGDANLQRGPRKHTMPQSACWVDFLFCKASHSVHSTHQPSRRY